MKRGYIGLLEDGTKFYIDLNSFFESHVGVLAKTGGGKSYLVGVLVEELTKAGIPTVIVDPHGEYRTLIYPNDDKRTNLFDEFGVGPKSFARHVNIFSLNGKHDLKLSLSESKLTVEDIMNLYPGKLKDSNKENLHRIIFRLRKKKYRINDIMKQASKMKSSSKYTLMGLLREVKSLKLFSQNPTLPSDLVKKHTTTVLDLNTLTKRMQKTVVSSILKMLFTARRLDKIPQFVLVLEESQIFSPQQGVVVSSEIVKDIATEGRKFGFCLIAVTQRPSRLHKDVLSQPAVQIYLKVTNPRDVQSIYESIENVTPELKDTLKTLNRGECLISGVVEDKTVKVKIRVKHSKHGGTSQKLMGDDK